MDIIDFLVISVFEQAVVDMLKFARVRGKNKERGCLDGKTLLRLSACALSFYLVC